MLRAVPGSSPEIDQVFGQRFADIGKSVTQIQRKVIQSVIDGHNTLALMPTGSGKSLCYWIAGQVLGGVTLVVFPLTALMDEQAEKLRAHGCSVCLLHSQIDGRKQYKELIELYNRARVPDYIFVSPERLATDGFLEFVLKHIHNQIKLLVVDEAHCISQWGLDFRPFYKEIPRFLDEVFPSDKRPFVLALTATLNPRDREEVCRDLSITDEHVIRHPDLLRHSINLHVTKVSDENAKDQRFWAFLDQHRDDKVLVYVDRKHGKRSTETLCDQAKVLGYDAAFFHGELESEVKADIIQRFRDGNLRMVFATSAFGMGIDIRDIRVVVHYLLTDSTEQYYQQIGRVGRDGKPSYAEMFYSDKNVEVRRKHYIERSFPDEEAVRKAFKDVTDGKTGHRTLNYFEESDPTQAGYHYLIRSAAISIICKGVRSLDAFEPTKGVSLPQFETYRKATRTGLIVQTASRLGLSESKILDDLYRWLAEGKLAAKRSPAKCLVLDVLQPEIPDVMMQSILADIEAKRDYRLSQFDEYVALLESYTNSAEFHRRIGEYLGVDKYHLGKHLQTLQGEYVRSKSEVIIANILFQTGIPYVYEQPLSAPGGVAKSPDFTLRWSGQVYYLSLIHI